MAEALTPDMVAARLPLYLRTLGHMAREGLTVTSSQEIGARLSLSPAQIRKDLSYFGKFGKQGTGYDVVRLREQLERILHVDQQWPLALVGAGALGQAVMHYGGFRERGFYIASVFDNAPGKVGQDVGGYVVLPSGSIPVEIPKRGIRIAVVAVPPEAAQEVVDCLVRAGVQAILNYAPISLIVPPGVQVQQIDPVIHLEHMTFYLEPK